MLRIIAIIKSKLFRTKGGAVPPKTTSKKEVAEYGGYDNQPMSHAKSRSRK